MKISRCKINRRKKCGKVGTTTRQNIDVASGLNINSAAFVSLSHRLQYKLSQKINQFEMKLFSKKQSLIISLRLIHRMN